MPNIRPSPTVTYRVICPSFFRPASPSLAIRSRGGRATVSNWMMMLALIYGVMDRAKMLASEKPPARHHGQEIHKVGGVVFLGRCRREADRVREGSGIHKGHRDGGTDAENQDDEQGVKDLFAQIDNLPCIP